MEKSGIRIAGLTKEEFEKLKAEGPKLKPSDNAHLKKILDDIANGVDHRSPFVEAMMNKSLPELYAYGPFGRPAPDVRQLIPTRSEPQPQKKQKLARPDQITRERCMVAAKLLWKNDPTMTIADVARHPNVDNKDITGARNYDQRTVRDWVAEAFPPNQPKQKGRSRKKLK